MSWLSTFLIEPLYRLLYGRPARFADETSRRGLILCVGGVGGFDLCGTGLRYVAAAERLPYRVELFRWSHGLGRWFADLTDTANCDRGARLLAEAVRRFRADSPGEPVFLVGKSGGAGIVVRALEQLEQNSVERAILLSPALSPRYNLTAALRAIHREMVVFRSPLDVVILGAGTRLFGTIDRVRTAGAGLVGFVQPGPDSLSSESMRQYAKLRQVVWTPRMAGFGHLGGHFGPDHPRFLRKYLVPLLREDSERDLLNLPLAAESAAPVEPGPGEAAGAA